MTWAIIAGLILLFGLTAYFALLVYDVKHDVTGAPRTDMFVCDKHGAIPAKYVLHLDGVTDKPIDYCPFCFSDRSKEAKKQLGL